MQGIHEYVNTNEPPDYLFQAIANAGKTSRMFQKADKIFRSFSNCLACRVFFVTAMTYRHFGGNRDFLVQLITKLCVWFKISDETVCQGAIDLNIDIFIYIFDNKPTLTADQACYIILQDFNCPGVTENRWVINVPPGISPPRVKHDDSSKESLKVIQITDIHYDPLYSAGANADCGQPICCSEPNGVAENPKDAAGYWGDYRPCDMPWYSIENLFQQIRQQHENIDIVYFTGDIISHRVWKTSNSENKQTIIKLYNKISESMGDIQVYPILGNHEPSPLNVWSPSSIDALNPSLSTQWIFNFVADEWLRWLPVETKSTIRRGGFYTVLHKPGFRIIGLNSNVCYVYNWWLLYSIADPYGQLQWLADTLQAAEKNFETVHILSHIPPGDSTCLKQWSKQYRRIINRFANTITAQFNGHTHYNEIRLFYNLSEPEQVVNVAYNGGSFTTYFNLDPNYRVYDVSRETLEVNDYEDWIYKLNEANATPNKSPRWFKLYSFKNIFDLPNTSLYELENLPRRMAANSTLLKEYFKVKVKYSSPSLEEGCSEDCDTTLLCEIVSVEYGDDAQCNAITQYYYLQKYGKVVMDQLFYSDTDRR